MPRAISQGPTGLRYGAYCLISLISAAAFQVMLSWSVLRMPVAFLYPAAASWLVQTIFPRHDRPSYIYCRVLSALLTAIGDIVLLIERHLSYSDLSTQAPGMQTLAIHSALAFLLLSECEHYRLYFGAKQFEFGWAAVVQTLTYANIDPDFKESRDALAYEIWLPASWARYWTTKPFNRSKDRFFGDGFKNALLFLLSLVVFYAVFGCLNYPVKRMLNPSPTGETFQSLATGSDILLAAENRWVSFLCWHLLRPVRLLNRMIFWWSAGLIRDVFKSGNRRQDH